VNVITLFLMITACAYFMVLVVDISTAVGTREKHEAIARAALCGFYIVAYLACNIGG
jgi:hypothetical protein